MLFSVVGVFLIGLLIIIYIEGKKRKMRVQMTPVMKKDGKSGAAESDRVSYMEGAHLMDFMDSERSSQESPVSRRALVRPSSSQGSKNNVGVAPFETKNFGR